ncbi:MAG: hypothetical protein KDD82_26960 [Planctomycetes bacterium]|nr:hypothetical protein [Planctomycetota bacterium]
MSARREFHFSQGASHEFWAITLDGATHRVDCGRVVKLRGGACWGGSSGWDPLREA